MAKCRLSISLEDAQSDNREGRPSTMKKIGKFLVIVASIIAIIGGVIFFFRNNNSTDTNSTGSDSAATAYAVILCGEEYQTHSASKNQKQAFADSFYCFGNKVGDKVEVLFTCKDCNTILQWTATVTEEVQEQTISCDCGFIRGKEWVRVVVGPETFSGNGTETSSKPKEVNDLLEILIKTLVGTVENTEDGDTTAEDNSTTATDSTEPETGSTEATEAPTTEE